MSFLFKLSKSKSRKKSIEKMSFIELIEHIPHVNPMNKQSIINSIMKGIDEVFLNPNNQTCFNFGYFTRQDFIDWANGTGRIVKGHTQEDKDRFMKYAIEYDKLHWTLFSYFEYIELINSNVILVPKSSTLSSNKWFIDVRKESEDQAINLLLSDMARDLKDSIKSIISYEKYKADLENREPDFSKQIEELYIEHDRASRSICRTMSLLGYGYFGACNISGDIKNLAWSKDLAFTRAYYDALIEIEYDLPDIKWVHENRF